MPTLFYKNVNNTVLQTESSAYIQTIEAKTDLERLCLGKVMPDLVVLVC